MDEIVIPLPRPLTTPPVTTTYLYVCILKGLQLENYHSFHSAFTTTKVNRSRSSAKRREWK